MVSLIIPFLNRSQYLGRLFDSLKGVRSAEIIFVDNGSDVQTRNDVAQFVEYISTTNPGVNAVLVDQPKAGAAAARNLGLDIATGEYVYFFDSDDELDPQMLVDAEMLANQTRSDVVALQTNLVMPNGKLVAKHIIRDTKIRNQIIANNFATQSLFLRRTFALQHARWNEKLFYWNDLEWGLRVLLANPIVEWLPNSYHKIYKHEDSITGKRFADSIDKILLAHEVMQEDVFVSKIPAEEKENLVYYFNCRKALYAGRIFKEGDKTAAKQLFATIDKDGLTFLSKQKLKLLYLLSALGIPGVWRLV